MQYLFLETAGVQNLTLIGDEHRYIFKVRRHREGESIALRNLKDDVIYFYKIISLDKKEAELQLESSKLLAVKAKKSLHLGCCVIDPKSIEKVLPTLNEMGVEKITFINCERSQKNFKLDFKRFEKILLNSSQQCGRSRLLELNSARNVKEFLGAYPKAKMLNFSEQNLNEDADVSVMIIGCEGGFTVDEVALFSSDNIIGLDTALILKSESAACAVTSKLLI